MDLKRTTLVALFWSFFEKIAQKGVKFVVSIILARILMPSDFGLIALVTMFLVIAQTFVDSGLGFALIQKKNRTFVDECTIFYTNIVIAVIADICIYFGAPFSAEYFNEPLLADILQVLCVVVVIDAVANIQLTVATIKIDFKTQFHVSFIVSVLSGSLGIYMAVNGYGIWSLVFMAMSRSVFSLIFLFYFVKWWPGLVYSLSSLRELFSFGFRIFLASLLDRIFNSLYGVVIAKVYSPVDLGLYGRAKSLQQLPVNMILQPVIRVTFPVYSQLQEDKVRLKRGVKKSLISLFFLISPMMIGLAITAESVVVLLLTDKWIHVVPYLQLLCFVGILFPINAINLNVLKALGRSDLFFKLEILKKVIVGATLAITYQHGILTMIAGMVFTSCIAFYLNAYFNGKLILYSFGEQLKDCVWLFLVSIIMGYCVYSVNLLAIESHSILLGVQVIVGIFSYTLLCYLLKVPILMGGIEKLKGFKAKGI